jgi:hypothetical protein
MNAYEYAMWSEISFWLGIFVCKNLDFSDVKICNFGEKS